MAQEIETSVPTTVGDLRAVIRIPDTPGPLPGVVLVDGSGDGDRHDWGGWPEWIGDAGSVVLRHDKPGCGGSPGHWTEQTLEDRAHESLAAVAVLREHPAVAGAPVGFYGISQGGWVALLAATIDPAVDFIVCHSGPGVSPAAQERDRIERELRGCGLADADVADGMAWVDERAARLLRNDDVAAIMDDQERYAERAWYPAVTFGAYDDPAVLAFVSRIFGFEPTSVMPKVSCPVLALFGGADTMVPVPESVAAFAGHLPPAPPDGHGLAVFPGANHGLFVADPDPAVPRRDQLAPGYLPMLTSWLSHVGLRRIRPGV